ncbi:hypothetical protein MFIFM68171_05754 [Madurella fahalii]|uniref:Major facilitator superfamily (MFS) profile domain-containing protein n=1 Tax=Madurella fahalii TaxID=1157608 RepID=A0ABQ0GCU8_9PEZI
MPSAPSDTDNVSKQCAGVDGNELGVVHDSFPKAPVSSTCIWKRIAASRRWTPRRCRQDSNREFRLTTSIVVLCTFSTAITAANLYYTYPVLNKAADEFGVSYEKASLIPQLLQAGYGVGILLLCPLGDVFRLRPIILTLMLTTTGAWIGLCITRSFEVFAPLVSSLALSLLAHSFCSPWSVLSRRPAAAPRLSRSFWPA